MYEPTEEVVAVPNRHRPPTPLPQPRKLLSTLAGYDRDDSDVSRPDSPVIHFD